MKLEVFILGGQRIEKEGIVENLGEMKNRRSERIEKESSERIEIEKKERKEKDTKGS